MPPCVSRLTEVGRHSVDLSTADREDELIQSLFNKYNVPKGYFEEKHPELFGDATSNKQTKLDDLSSGPLASLLVNNGTMTYFKSFWLVHWWCDSSLCVLSSVTGFDGDGNGDDDVSKAFLQARCVRFDGVL